MGWLSIWFSATLTTLLMALALGSILLERYGRASIAYRLVERVTGLPSWLWIITGGAAFILPVLAYWMSAYSPPNAIAGYLPWNDAAGYFGCAQSYLLGAEIAADCGRRPFYISFFTDLLWLTGNEFQTALLLQAAVVGAAAILFLRMISKDMNGPALLAAYSVLFLFAAKFGAALVMTENAGLLLGCVAFALLWRAARDTSWLLFCTGIGVLAAALNARAGAMLVLPAAIGWALFHSGGYFRKRAVLAGLGLAAVVAGLTVTTLPTLIVEGELGAAQSNFSYSFYGMVVGGKGWQQVMTDHPDIFSQSRGVTEETRAIYRAALDSILSRPDLLIFGYLKGLLHYFANLFKFAHEFKFLHFAIFLPLWLAGVWFAARHRRDPVYAMMLWLQAGILVSAPFITFDGGNRIYAATMPVDALFVGLGVMWISARFRLNPAAAIQRAASARGSMALVIAGIAIVLVPISTLIAIRLGNTKMAYARPVCASGLEPVVVRPGRSSLMLPFVSPGQETMFPLRVRADHVAERFHKDVNNKFEFRREPGTTLVWGTRLGKDKLGQPIFFAWKGPALTVGEVVGFCVKRPVDPEKNIGIATAIRSG